MAFAPSKRRRLKTTEPVGLMLTSMMDVMVIILLFLLKTYAVTGALMHPSVENLPLSTSEKAPRKTLSLVLTSDGLYEDVEGFTEMSQRERESHLIAPASELNNNSEVTLPSLEQFLKERRQLEVSLGKAALSREITVQAEKDTPYASILRLINTSSASGYDVIEFLVENEDGDGS